MAEAIYQSNPKMFRSRPMLFLFWLAVAAAGVAAIVMMPGANVRMAGIGAIFIGIFALLIWYVNCKTTLITISANDVALRHGILSKSTNEIQIDHIRSVNVYQSLWQRIFRVGRLSIFTAGDTPEISINGLPDPGRLRDLLRSGGVGR